MRGAKKYLAGLITSILVANCSWLGGSKELAEYKALLEQSNLPPQTQEVEDKSYIYLSRKVGDTYVELKIDPSRHNVRIDLSPKKEKESIIEASGIVIEILPNANFKVKLQNEHIILAHTAGRIRKKRKN